MSHPEAPQAAQSGTQSLEERYGTSRQLGLDRRVAWIVAALAVAGGLAFLLFSGWREVSAIETQDIGRTFHSDTEVEVRFQVTAPPDTPVACAVEAQNATKAVVGWKVVELPVTEQRTHAVTTSLLTTNRAETGHVRECWALQENR